MSFDSRPCSKQSRTRIDHPLRSQHARQYRPAGEPSHRAPDPRRPIGPRSRRQRGVRDCLCRRAQAGASASLSFRCPPERVPELIWIRTPLLDPNLGGVIPGAESPGRVLALYHPLVSSPAVQRSPLPQKMTAILSSLVNRPNRNRPAPPSPPQRTSPRSPSPSRSSRPLRFGARCTARRPQTQKRC